MLDHYATLEVRRDATQDEIKRAFRRLAKELHPDVNPSPISSRRFKMVSEAYDILSDETKRRQYDRERATTGPTRNGREADDGFEQFFRNTRANTGPNKPRDRAAEAFLKGADLHHALTVTFVEAALGSRKRAILSDRRTVHIAVPPLTQDAQTLRLKGMGSPGTFGGAAGDLLVDVSVEPHPAFVRRGCDIHMGLPVSIPEALLGAAIVVETVHGAVQLKVPPGSNTDSVLRLKGMGLPQPQGGLGDQYVTLKVMLPPPSDTEFPKLVETWAKRKPYRARS